MRNLQTVWQERRSETAILIGIVLVGGLFRFYRIGEIPPGLQFDEAYYAFDALRLLQGQFAIFFTANNGREPLYLYLTMVGVAVFGAQSLALRLTSALIGTATIPLVYGFVRYLFRSMRVAAFTAGLTAISVWHVYYSRYGLRVILVVPLTVLTLWWFWRALNRNRWRDYALAGVCASLTAYTYLSGRILPFILVTLTTFAIALDRTQVRIYIKGLVLTALVALLLFLPLGSYFLTHPQDFAAHAVNLSLLDPRVNQGNMPLAFLENLGVVAGMFLLRGDDLEFRNIANRPVFDPFVGILFLTGLAMLLKALFSRASSRQERLRAIFIAVPLLFFLAASVFSDDAPNFTRTLAALPFATILAGWGAETVWQRFELTAVRPLIAGLLGIALLASAGIAVRDYFVGFAGSPSLYYSFDVDRFDAAQWINENSSANHIYLAPLWYQHGTISLITRNTPLKSFESRDTVVLPSNVEGKDALFAYPLEQEKKAEKLGERVGAIGTLEQVTGTNGARILSVYRVRAAYLPDGRDPLPALFRGGSFLQPQKLKHVAWGDQMELLGYTADPEGPGGRNLVVTLFVHALRPMSEDYTFSIKVRDEKDRVWGQEDKWLGDNSYATSQMTAGDVVIERFYPGLNACAPAGDHHITVEAYNPRTMQVLALSGGDANAVLLDITHAEASQSNRLEDLEPAQALDLQVAPQMRLLGITLEPSQIRGGDAFSLALYWRGIGDGTAARRVTIRLAEQVLVERDIALPEDGRGLCTLFDLRAPADLAGRTSAIFVNDKQIASLDIVR